MVGLSGDYDTGNKEAMMDNPYQPPREEGKLPESSDSLSLGLAVLRAPGSG